MIAVPQCDGQTPNLKLKMTAASQFRGRTFIVTTCMCDNGKAASDDRSALHEWNGGFIHFLELINSPLHTGLSHCISLTAAPESWILLTPNAIPSVHAINKLNQEQFNPKQLQQTLTAVTLEIAEK